MSLKHLINIFFRYPSMTWIGFFSQMGGLLGLCLGFSLLSGVELLYWLLIVLFRNMIRERVVADSESTSPILVESSATTKTWVKQEK